MERGEAINTLLESMDRIERSREEERERGRKGKRGRRYSGKEEPAIQSVNRGIQAKNSFPEITISKIGSANNPRRSALVQVKLRHLRGYIWDDLYRTKCNKNKQEKILKISFNSVQLTSRRTT